MVLTLYCHQELPFVRYRAAKSLDANTMTAYRDLIPTKLAAKVWDYLTKYMTSAVDFPQTETCELLILDRSIDQVFVCFTWLYARCNGLLLQALYLAILYFSDCSCHT